jgi:hypothetical protein
MKVHQIDETSGSEEEEYVLTLFGVPSFVCTVKTYPSSSLPDVSSIWCTFIEGTPNR